MRSRIVLSFFLALTVALSGFAFNFGLNLFSPSQAIAGDTFVCQYSFTRNLSLGSTGPDVTFLQQVLNTSADTEVAPSGTGSRGQESTYFGPATKAAVISFQNKYASELLAPQGLLTGTGFFGPSTQAKLNQICNGQSQQLGSAEPVAPTIPIQMLPLDTYVIDAGTNAQLSLQAKGLPGASYSVDKLPSGATFDTGSGLLAWTPGPSAKGDYVFNFSITGSATTTVYEKTIVIKVANYVSVPGIMNPITVPIITSGPSTPPDAPAPLNYPIYDVTWNSKALSTNHGYQNAFWPGGAGFSDGVTYNPTEVLTKNLAVIARDGGKGPWTGWNIAPDTLTFLDFESDSTENLNFYIQRIDWFKEVAPNVPVSIWGLDLLNGMNRDQVINPSPSQQTAWDAALEAKAPLINKLDGIVLSAYMLGPAADDRDLAYIAAASKEFRKIYPNKLIIGWMWGAYHTAWNPPNDVLPDPVMIQYIDTIRANTDMMVVWGPTEDNDRLFQLIHQEIGTTTTSIAYASNSNTADQLASVQAATQSFSFSSIFGIFTQALIECAKQTAYVFGGLAAFISGQ